MTVENEVLIGIRGNLVMFYVSMMVIGSAVIYQLGEIASELKKLNASRSKETE